MSITMGETAPPEFIEKIVYVCAHHDARIFVVDTVRAYHLGERFIVEVDFVLPRVWIINPGMDYLQPKYYKVVMFII